MSKAIEIKKNILKRKITRLNYEISAILGIGLIVPGLHLLPMLEGALLFVGMLIAIPVLFAVYEIPLIKQYRNENKKLNVLKSRQKPRS